MTIHDSVYAKLGSYEKTQVKSVSFSGCCNRDASEAVYSGQTPRGDFWTDYEQYLMGVPASEFEWTLFEDGELSIFYLEPCQSSVCEGCQESGDA